MAVFLNRDPFGHEPKSAHSSHELETHFRESDSRCLDIGLVNNMPDKALQSTARQFARLLNAGSDGFVVRLSHYALPEVPRSDFGRHHVTTRYFSIESLWNNCLDGLIVTGTEPRTANLMDEPYWGSLAKVFDWADRNTHSTILSCLGAHAGVLHFDGIGRRSFADKCFGIFESTSVSEYLLTASVPSHFPMPHSRWNGLSEYELSAAGYLPLTRLHGGGVDAFLRQRNSLFVFFQGHPEYEPDTLFLEYRRDVGRYLRREREAYPSAPVGYFSPGATERFAAFARRAMSDRRDDLLAEFPDAGIDKELGHRWAAVGGQIYRNWLGYLSSQKEQRLMKSKGHAKALTTRTAP
jgi:homoserine O-succinyltransferase